MVGMELLGAQIEIVRRLEEVTASAIQEAHVAEGLEPAKGATGERSAAMAKLASARTTLAQTGRKVERGIAEWCLKQPAELQEGWRSFCREALENGWEDYQERGLRWRTLLDGCLDVMRRHRALAGKLKNDGVRVRNVALLDQAIRELQAMRDQIFDRWPVPLHDLQQWFLPEEAMDIYPLVEKLNDAELRLLRDRLREVLLELWAGAQFRQLLNAELGPALSEDAFDRLLFEAVGATAV
jgi:hypothetical protein